MVKEKKVGVVASGVTDEDRELWWGLARKYMRDRAHPTVQRWAWEKAASFINPKVAAVEADRGASKEFVVKVEDYRSKKEVLPVVVFGAANVDEAMERAITEDVDEGVVDFEDEDMN